MEKKKKENSHHTRTTIYLMETFQMQNYLSGRIGFHSN